MLVPTDRYGWMLGGVLVGMMVMGGDGEGDGEVIRMAIRDIARGYTVYTVCTQYMTISQSPNLPIPQL